MNPALDSTPEAMAWIVGLLIFGALWIWFGVRIADAMEWIWRRLFSQIGREW